MNNKGVFAVSLDFELMWGVIDKHSPQTYGTSVADVHTVLPHMVRMFNKYGVHATVATVGFIAYENKKILLKHLPNRTPSYTDLRLSPYCNNYIASISDADSDLYFAPNLVELLRNSDNVELASHTFCHYYCTADGQNIDEFEADIKAAVATAQKKGYQLRSIVFPRNQVNSDYVNVCRKYGFLAYRGNPEMFFNVRNPFISIFARAGRIIDTYVNITGNNTVSFEEILTKTKETSLVNVPASRFLRPYSKTLSLLDWLKIKRIKNDMTYAAKHGRIYHLWWHPHNFGGKYRSENMRMLEDILNHFRYLQTVYGMVSMTMNEIASYVIDNNKR